MILCKDPDYVGVYINTLPKIFFGICIYALHRWTVASFLFIYTQLFFVHSTVKYAEWRVY